MNVMNVLMTLVVVIALAGVIAATASSYVPSVRPLLWLALAEYLTCAGAQIVYSRVVVQGGDLTLYADTGAAGQARSNGSAYR